MPLKEMWPQRPRHTARCLASAASYFFSSAQGILQFGSAFCSSATPAAVTLVFLSVTDCNSLHSASGDKLAIGVLSAFKIDSGIPLSGDKSASCELAQYRCLSCIPRKIDKSESG